MLGGEPSFSALHELYEAGPDEVLQIVRRTPEDVATLLYIGHNPAAAVLVGLLAGTEVLFPAAAIAVIACPGEWAGLAPGAGDIIASWSPHGQV